MLPSENQIRAGTLLLTTAIDDGAEVISLKGELDLANAPILEGKLREALTPGGGRVVLDMSELSFIDSTGIALLVAALRRDRQGARLRFVPSNSLTVRRVLELTGLESRLPLAELKPIRRRNAPRLPADR